MRKNKLRFVNFEKWRRNFSKDYSTTVLNLESMITYKLICLQYEKEPSLTFF